MPQPRFTFVRLLRSFNIAQKRGRNGGMKHDEIAASLGISKVLLENWLYRDAPSDLMAAMLLPKLKQLIQSRK